MFEAVDGASFHLLKYVSTVKYKSIVPSTSAQVNPVALETSDKIVVLLRTIAKIFPNVLLPVKSSGYVYKVLKIISLTTAAGMSSIVFLIATPLLQDVAKT